MFKIFKDEGRGGKQRSITYLEESNEIYDKGNKMQKTIALHSEKDEITSN